jgi:hypothetical protein
LVIVLRSLDWYLWMTAILDLVAQPHSSNPYVHTGFSTALYMRSLFFNDRGECWPVSQYISGVFLIQLLAFRYHVVFQVRRLSKCSPRYLTVSAWGTAVWLMYTGGHCPRRRSKSLCLNKVMYVTHVVKDVWSRDPFGRAV